VYKTNFYDSDVSGIDYAVRAGIALFQFHLIYCHSVILIILIGTNEIANQIVPLMYRIRISSR